MSFDYFSKNRVQYILTKLKDIFDTKANISDVPDAFADLTDVEITSPVSGQIPVYNSTTGKWENGNVSSVFTLTLTQDETYPYDWHCDKTPNEVINAYNAQNIIQIIGNWGASHDYDESDSYNLTYYSLEDSTLELHFSNCDINSDDTSVFYSSEVNIISFKLVSDDLSSWDINSCFSNIVGVEAEIYEDDNVYYCDVTPEDLIHANSNINGRVVVTDDDGIYKFSKYDNGTYYFTSSNVNSSNELSVKTYAMTPNNDNSDWASIVKYETNGSGDVIWTGTQAELALVVNTLPEGAIINITDDQEVIGGSLAALSDTNISSPTNGQGLIYDSTTQKWQNQNLPSGTDIFTITITESVDPQTGEVTFTSDKLPSEVVAAKNSGSIIRLTVTDIANFYFDLSIDHITEEETVFIFINVRASSNHQVVFVGFNLIKDANSDTWASIEFLNPEFKETVFVEMEENSGEYSCNVDFNTLDDAYYHSMDMIVEFESEFFRLVKYDTSENTFYFANTISDSNGIKTKTFVMVGDSSENEWTSITLTESSGGGTGDTPIWTGTTAEYIAQASQIATGTIVNITDDINNIPQFKVTNFTVGTTGWTTDTTSQSGTTLYKKQISVNNIYSSPSVDIGASTGHVLPTTDEQAAYNLLQYVTFDSSVPCLYLYAKSEPANAFNINVGGVD